MGFLNLLDEYIPTAISTESIIRMELERPIKNDEGEIIGWKKEDARPRLGHAVIGLGTETGELRDAQEAEGKELDKVNIIEECGDVIWYLAIIMDSLEWSFSDLGVEKWNMTLNEAISEMKSSADQILDKYKRFLFYGKGFEEEAVRAEIEKIIGVMACLCSLADGSIELAIEKVTHKLTKVRFQNGFNQEDAYNRDLKEERKGLESKSNV
jgi:NTP pyrophosphatase (non-canonical NTP hydrolase)